MSITGLDELDLPEAVESTVAYRPSSAFAAGEKHNKSKHSKKDLHASLSGSGHKNTRMYFLSISLEDVVQGLRNLRHG